MDYIDDTDYREGKLKAKRWLEWLEMSEGCEEYFSYLEGASEDYDIVYLNGKCVFKNRNQVYMKRKDI